MSYNTIELLAPAGTPRALRAALEAGADAVYIGGRGYNMRLLRPGFNFGDSELREAVQTAHDMGRRLYLTVNNLYIEEEMDRLAEHLLFLQDIGCDALILQDLGVLKLARELGLTVPLHASVQMTVNNAGTVNALARQGVSRVILSRNLTPEEITAIHAECEIGLEHFVHGEQCISHSGQCWLSGMFGDRSGNRGRCFKPCRWEYRLNGRDDWQYRLAPNDMNLYALLPQMIAAGVISLKIEGRMLAPEHIARLVRVYREALDKLAMGGEDWRDEAAEAELYRHRVRDFVTSVFGGETGPEFIGYDGSREPLFVSTGCELPPEDDAPGQMPPPFELRHIPELSVKLYHPDRAEALLAAGTDNLIVPLMPYRQRFLAWDAQNIARVARAAHAGNGRVWLEAPRIMSQREQPRWEQWLQWGQSADVDGYIVHDLGSLSLLCARGLCVTAGEGFNIANRRTAELLLELGAQRVRLSLELGYEELLRLTAQAPAEILVQGMMTALISDHCQAAAEEGLKAGEDCAQRCLADGYGLKDRQGRDYRILSDMACRSHYLFPVPRCLLTRLPELLQAGLRSALIDGGDDDGATLERVRQYSRLLHEIPAGAADMTSA
ncbi:MAG: U32 family peptidase [Syntrophomonadaceae bacterium]|nr:U32 family peptidase [Syntrophomonadaceae bacterium]